MNRLLLTIDDFAAALAVSRRKVYLLRKRPDFPAPIVLSNRCVRYRTADVASFVDRLAADSAPTLEPEQLRQGRTRRLRSADESSGGTTSGMAAKPRPAGGTAEGRSVDLDKEVS